MKTILLIFAGGGVGSLLRFGVHQLISRFYHQSFPLGTWVANVLACLLLGFVIGLADHKQWLSAEGRLFMTVGVCGGFSTFSTFSYELLSLTQNGQQTTAIIYTLLSIVCCLLATYLGFYLAITR